MPWYVGKTEKRDFGHGCFQVTKINYYNEALTGDNGNRRGRSFLFLIPRLNHAGKFSKPTRKQYRDVDYLETMLIGISNHNLLNIRKTKMLREMVVPGIVNPVPGNTKKSVRDLKHTLGLDE